MKAGDLGRAEPACAVEDVEGPVAAGRTAAAT